MGDHGRPGMAFERGPVPAWKVRHRAEPAGPGRAQLLGVLLVVASAAFVGLDGLTLATARGNAFRTLRAVLPALTDLDQVLAVHGPDLRAVAGVGGTVAVPGLPVPVAVSADAARTDAAQVRREALDIMVAAVYRDGDAAFRVPDARSNPAPGLFTQQWSIRRSLSLLTESSHDRYATWRTLAGLATLALVLLLVLSLDARKRAVAAGSAIGAGAVLAMGAALAGRAVVWLVTSGDTDIAASVVARVARDLAATVIAIGAIAGVAAAIVAIAGIVIPRIVPDSPKAAGPSAPRRQRASRGESWEEP